MRWILLLFVVLAMPAHASSWEYVVARLASPYGARWTPEEAEPSIGAACDAGHEAACRIEIGESVSVALERACEEGDAAACLGHGWRRQKDDPIEAFAHFQALCEQGGDRACVAVADARFRGLGTWGSRRLGRLSAEGLCREGVADACVLLAEITGDRRPEEQGRHLRRARLLGATGAEGRLALLAPRGPERVEALQGACRAGSPESCWELAARREQDAAQLAGRACALGVEPACVAGPALALERGLVDVAAATAAVDRHCREGIEEACIAARFYRNGGRPPAFPVGFFGPAASDLLVDDKIAYLLDCYRQRLEGGDTSVAVLHLELAASDQGEVIAVTSSEPEMDRCYADVLLGTQGLRPRGGPARFDIDITLTHEARINVDPVGRDDALSNVGRAEWRYIAQLGLDANACYLEGGGSVFDRQFAVMRGTLRTTGFYAHEGIVESSGDEATDACIVDLIERLHVPEVEMPFDQEVFVRFDFNRVTRAPRFGRSWGVRKALSPPLDLSRHNQSSVGTAGPMSLTQ